MKSMIMFVFTCLVTTSSYAAKNLESVYPGDKGVTLVSSEKTITQISKKLENVDVAVEMGDGYYDVDSIKLFRVKSGAKTVGYIEEYSLLYTEDPVMVTVLVRYNLKGERVGDLEETSREYLPD